MLSYGVMVLVAVAASVTDLRRGTIPNRLVLVGIGLGALLQVGLWMLQGGGATDEVHDRALLVLANAAMGLGTGFVLYLLGLMSAGDAKLLFVLGLAHPAGETLGGPVPWAPVLVVLGNAFVVALTFVFLELVVRGLPRLVRAARSGALVPGKPAWPQVRHVARIVLVVSALAVSLSPLRQWAAASVGGALSGGTFFVFAALYIAYKPLKLVAMRPWGVPVASGALLLSVGLAIWLHGEAGAAGVGRSLLIATGVVLVRALVGLSSRAFDGKSISIEELEPGMVLAPAFLARLTVEPRWATAFAPVVGDLRGVKLDSNLIENLREWHAHNAPDTPVEVVVPLPFSPALAISVVLSAATGRLLFVL